MRDPTKGHAALRRGRVSIPHAEYFVTICMDQHRVGLTTPNVAAVVLAEMRAMTDDATWQLRCAVVMPDHIHLLFVLGERLSLGKCVARLKSKTKPALMALDRTLDCERDFFDRHIRPEDERLSLFLYVFLNPYRAGLCSRTDRWPWYFCREEDWAWFAPLLDQDRPVPEWLQD
jgi:putative transposase